MNSRKIVSTLKKVIKNPKIILAKILIIFSPYLSDDVYLRLYFRIAMNNKLHLDNPKTFNEKLQWLKINFRTLKLTQLVDKYEAKQYVGKIIGHEYIVPNLGVWNNFDEIDFTKLPDKFVLKTTHDSGGVIICHNKNEFDKKKAKRILSKHLRTNYYLISKEWPYKNVPRRIIAETLLEPEENEEIFDYKIYCFNGNPKVLFIASERNTGNTKFNYFDMNFSPLDLKQGGERSNRIFQRPKNFELMKTIASKISKDLPHVRIDFFEVNGHLYFGEATFFDSGGMAPFYPQTWDYIFGSWIDLSKTK